MELLMRSVKALLIFKLLVTVTCDYNSLMSCGGSTECWHRLDREIVDVIGDNLHNGTDPCQNFWYYACGSWKPPRGQHHKDNFGIVLESYVRQMELLLEADVRDLQPAIDELNLLNTLRTYYRSCKDTNFHRIEASTYLDEIPEPFISSWLERVSGILNGSKHEANDFSWVQILATLRRYGFNGVLIEERATVAYNDATKYTIELKMPDEDAKFEKKFEIVNYFVEFGLVESATDRAWRLAAQIFDLELQLKDLRDKHSLDEDATFEESLSLAQVKSKVPNIDWKTYFNVLLNQKQVGDELPIEINGIAYFSDVAALLAQTDNDVVSLYISAHLCRYILDTRPRKGGQNCVEHMGVIFPLGMNFLYDRYIYTTRSKDEQALHSIFGNLKSKFKSYLTQNKLNLNSAELRFIAEKVDKMTMRIGNLPRNASTHFYNHYYDDVRLIDSNFYRNHWKMLNFRTAQQHIGFLKHRIHIDLDTFYVYDDIDQVRSAPYFVHEQNLLLVPMVFLQLPFFHHSLDTLLQYSLVGFILGHEFNHAFEKDGIVVDANGNENSIGFGIRRKSEFISNMKCFQQTPTESLVERMADVNGFQLVFDAYFDKDDADESASENTIRRRALHENGSEKQLYFLNFAQFFCGELPAPIDHDRDDVRVNEIVRNSREFAETFQCGNYNDDIKAIKRCEMWRS